MSLLRTASRAAVASSVHGRVQRRQRARWAQHDYRAEAMPPAPAVPSQTTAPSPGAGSSDAGRQLELLAQLGELRKAGVLTDDEFAQKKAEILSS
jgi:hypothetical protein